MKIFKNVFSQIKEKETLKKTKNKENTNKIFFRHKIFLLINNKKKDILVSRKIILKNSCKTNKKSNIFIQKITDRKRNNKWKFYKNKIRF